jgi:acyl carrier protein
MIQMDRLIELVASAEVLDDMSQFDPDRTFVENGIDSLDIMVVYIKLEQELGITFSNSEVIEIKSAREMLAAINVR